MRINYRLLFPLFLILSYTSALAQDSAFARKTMQTLCSPYYAGRGYVDHGADKAAQYIAGIFNQYKLKTFAEPDRSFKKAEDYYLPFNTMQPNTFPGKLVVALDKNTLHAGADYIVEPSSAGCKPTSYKLYYTDSALLAGLSGTKLEKKFKGKAVVFNDNWLKKRHDEILMSIIKSGAAALVERVNGRLVWSVEQYVLPIPFVQIKASVFRDKNKKITLEIEQKKERISAQNVAGYVRGKKYPDSFILLTAHYDHLGKMGKDTYFPGANDNASGVAILLDLVRYYTIYPADYSIAFVTFTGEEAGLVGSKYFTENPPVPLKQMAFVINMDLMANGQDGMMVVNGGIFTHDYKRLVHLNDSMHTLKEIKARGKAANSDHYWFTEKGVKAFFFYLLGDYPYYHDIYDTADKPSLAGYNGAFKLITSFVDTYGR